MLSRQGAGGVGLFDTGLPLLTDLLRPKGCMLMKRRHL